MDLNALAARECPGVLELAQAHDFDRAHAFQVARLSLLLFDGSAPLHALGRAERRLLPAAAVLHDIGLSRGVAGHHKSSRDIILSRRPESLSPIEAQIVALVSRYHRKALPSLKHGQFARLGRHEREIVRRLAAILRIADGLDRPHSAAVAGIGCDWTDAEVIITVSGDSPLDEEIRGAERKRDLFEEVSGRAVRVVAVE